MKYSKLTYAVYNVFAKKIVDEHIQKVMGRK